MLPLIKNANKTPMLKMVLKDETKEMKGVCYAKVAIEWAKNLYV